MCGFCGSVVVRAGDQLRKVRRVDLMRYGHAMSVPVPGVRSSAALATLAAPQRRGQFAHADLSGYSVFEEALFHGTRAGAAAAARQTRRAAGTTVAATGDHCTGGFMPASSRSLAIVTGASSGIGYHLARECAQAGFDLLVAADRAEIEQAAADFRSLGAAVDAIQCDLSTTQGVDALVAAAAGRPIDALLANAGHGLGKAYLDQDWNEIRGVIDTNITGTVYLVHRLGTAMRQRGSGRILFTGSIAGFMPGTFQAVYNGTKAFIDSFSFALRNELKDSGVTVSVLMPGATDTDFFERADMMDTKVGAGEKDDPADVAKVGFKAMMAGEGDVVSGLKNKLQAAVANVTPSAVLAEQHRKMAEPGSAGR